MIRIEKENDWWLLGHADHARLAGEFARHWKNNDFSPPKPFAHILDAVSRHDDSWKDRDACPDLTPEGHPSAFSKELVGSYDAFEDIDLEAYLGVRGQATEQAAVRDPYSAILISMHTVNLLTEQADLESLDDASRKIHSDFIEGQLARQVEIIDALKTQSVFDGYLTEEVLQENFEFLQACDSFSLLVGVDYESESSLRHTHSFRGGDKLAISYIPLGNDKYQLAPWPLDEPELTFYVPYKCVPKSLASSLETFRETYAATPTTYRKITVVGGSI
jgi:hypothetical protein